MNRAPGDPEDDDEPAEEWLPHGITTTVILGLWFATMLVLWVFGVF